jgi:SAM-dependent methyltransferase
MAKRKSKLTIGSDGMNSKQPVFLKFRGQLAMFKPWTEGPQGWEDRWANRSLIKLIKKHSKGQLGELEEVFMKYMPRDLPVLEAGCGMGHYVMALSSRGFKVEGIDYAEQTIERVKTFAPELKVRIADITKIDVPDGTYGGYISLGVFEHNPNGPLQGLKEARRVVHPSGVAFISMPYLNRKRRRFFQKVSTTEEISLSNGLRFYQYYFSRKDFEALLRESGFKVIEDLPIAIYAGFTRDYQLGRWLHQHHFFSHRIHRWVLRRCKDAPLWARRRWAHMLLLVCRPVGK